MELHAWTSFVDVVKNFLGNRRTENYNELVEKLLKSLQDIGANMSMKVHFLHSQLDKLSDNYGNVSNEQGERFRQDIKTMEERYQGRWDKLLENQERGKFYDSSYVYEGFISADSLLNDLIKIFVLYTRNNNNNADV